MDCAPRDRVHAVALELADLGMAPEAALDASSHFAVRSALPRRGVPSVARQLARRGLEPARCQGAAALILALEILERGYCFADVVRFLGIQGVAPEAAAGAALQASRIHRSLPRLPAEAGDAHLPLVALVSAALALAVIAVQLLAG